MDRIKINFSKNQKLPTGMTIEWWECDEHYHWVIDDDNYSIPFCNRFDAYKSAWVYHKKQLKGGE